MKNKQNKTAPDVFAAAARNGDITYKQMLVLRSRFHDNKKTVRPDLVRWSEKGRG